MMRRYRGPILWGILGVLVVLAYVVSQPVPIPIDDYVPPTPATPAVEANAAAPAALPETAAPPNAPTPALPEPAAAVAEPAPANAVVPLPAAATPEPAVQPLAATPAAPPAEAMYVSATSLNLRAAPLPAAAVLEVLPRGTRVDVIGTAEGWREVVNPATGVRGWMAAEYLADTPPAAAAPAAAAPAAPAAAPAGGAAPGLTLVP